MAKKKDSTAEDVMPAGTTNVLRSPAEVLFAREIEALAAADKYEKPPGWNMSPRAVLTYICGGTVGGLTITPKYFGYQRLVEIAISTLVTDRALLLIGEPGTAKSWLSEHLAAAINGDSSKVVQGTAGTTEEQVRYTWNYALLIARGPSPEALIPSPILRAMESGTLARFEEITALRVGSAGRHDFDPFGKDDRDPGAEIGSAREEGLLDHCHRKHTRPGRQRHVGRLEAAVQYRRAANTQDD